MEGFELVKDCGSNGREDMSCGKATQMEWFEEREREFAILRKSNSILFSTF